MPDTLVNGGYSTVATAPSPATSGTTLVVQAGDGAKYPQTGSFDVVLCPVGQLPLFFGTNKNAEIARATISTDTLTLTRAQYGTTAMSVAIGWAVDNAVTANLLGQFLASSEVDAPNGVAPLDASGLVPLANLPIASTSLALTGSGTPSNTLGLNGDYYIDEATGNFYGPKAAGVWPAFFATLAYTASPTFTGVVTAPVLSFAGGPELLQSGTAVVARGGSSSSGAFLFKVQDSDGDSPAGVVCQGAPLAGLFTTPLASQAPATALVFGTAWQNPNNWDVTLLVSIAITANTSLVVSLGIGSTSTPTQQTLITGTVATGVFVIPIKVPGGYYALLSHSGTGTIAIAGQMQLN